MVTKKDHGHKSAVASMINSYQVLVFFGAVDSIHSNQMMIFLGEQFSLHILIHRMGGRDQISHHLDGMFRFLF